MNYKTAEEAARIFSSLDPKTKLCPYCYWLLQQVERGEGGTLEGEWYCPNELCLYDERGVIHEQV